MRTFLSVVISLCSATTPAKLLALVHSTRVARGFEPIPLVQDLASLRNQFQQLHYPLGVQEKIFKYVTAVSQILIIAKRNTRNVFAASPDQFKALSAKFVRDLTAIIEELSIQVCSGTVAEISSSVNTGSIYAALKKAKAKGLSNLGMLDVMVTESRQLIFNCQSALKAIAKHITTESEVDCNANEIANAMVAFVGMLEPGVSICDSPAVATDRVFNCAVVQRLTHPQSSKLQLLDVYKKREISWALFIAATDRSELFSQLVNSALKIAQRFPGVNRGDSPEVNEAALHHNAMLDAKQLDKHMSTYYALKSTRQATNWFSDKPVMHNLGAFVNALKSYTSSRPDCGVENDRASEAFKALITVAAEVVRRESSCFYSAERGFCIRFT